MRQVRVAQFAAVLAVSGPASAQSVTLIPPAPGLTASRIYGISADGLVAAGNSSGSSTFAFTWTAAGGRNDFGLEPDMPELSAAWALSEHGTTAVGYSRAGAGPLLAFRWQGPGTFQSLGALPGLPTSVAFGVSGDGEVVAGSASTSTGSVSRAFRWTQSEGMTNLGVARPSDFYSEARAVSRDGTAIVGQSFGALPSAACVWNSTTGLTILSPLPGRPDAVASGVNHDATLIVGNSTVNLGQQGLAINAVMWVNGVPMDLGLAPGSNRSYATAVNDAGTVVVGQVRLSNFDFAAAIWTPQTGMVTLSSYLTGIGVTIPQGVSLLEATGVSADGRTIVGYTGLPGQIRQGFVATIPAPGTGSLLALTLTATFRRRR